MRNTAVHAWVLEKCFSSTGYSDINVMQKSQLCSWLVKEAVVDVKWDQIHILATSPSNGGPILQI